MSNTQVCLCLFLLGTVFAAASQSDKYRISHAAHIDIYDDQRGIEDILAQVRARSKIQCADKCVNNRDCFSFFYNKNTSVCQTHGDGFDAESSKMFPGGGFKYYKVATRRGVTTMPSTSSTAGITATSSAAGLVGHICSTSFDCLVLNAECRTEGVCGCKIGYSFHLQLQECVHGCATYGDTFQLFRGQFILFATEEDIIYNTTPLQCAQLCINHTRFRCVTFETWPSSDWCFLQDKGFLDVDPSTHRSDNAFDHYQRNCA